MWGERCIKNFSTLFTSLSLIICDSNYFFLEYLDSWFRSFFYGLAPFADLSWQLLLNRFGWIPNEWDFEFMQVAMQQKFCIGVWRNEFFSKAQMSKAIFKMSYLSSYWMDSASQKTRKKFIIKAQIFPQNTGKFLKWKINYNFSVIFHFFSYIW